MQGVTVIEDREFLLEYLRHRVPPVDKRAQIGDQGGEAKAVTVSVATVRETGASPEGVSRLPTNRWTGFVQEGASGVLDPYLAHCADDWVVWFSFFVNDLRASC
jgi:hypothetical protein